MFRSLLIISLILIPAHTVFSECSEYIEFTQRPNGKVLLERKSILYVEEYYKNGKEYIPTIWYKTPGENVPIEVTESFKDIKSTLQCDD